MSAVQVVINGIDVNHITIDPAATVSSDGAKITWPGGEIDASAYGAGAVFMSQAGAQIGDILQDGVLVTPPVAAAPPPTAAQLLAYAEAKRAAIGDGGISVNIAAAGATPQMVEVGTDTAALAFLANAVQLTSTAPGTSYDWDQAEAVTLTGAQVLQIQAAVGLFVQELFTEKTAIRSAIAAGTITTFAQIDDPTIVNLPAWPANS